MKLTAIFTLSCTTSSLYLPLHIGQLGAGLELLLECDRCILAEYVEVMELVLVEKEVASLMDVAGVDIVDTLGIQVAAADMAATDMDNTFCGGG